MGSDTDNLIIFDGECVFCSRFARFVLWQDKREVFRFVTAQSPLGRELFEKFGLDADDYDTYVVVRHGAPHYKMDAVATLLSAIGWPWKLGGLLARLLPRALGDWGYDLIATNRYKIFGRQSCMVPDENMRRRFLGQDTTA